MKLRKVRSRGAQDDFWRFLSARWAVVDVPDLIIQQTWNICAPKPTLVWEACLARGWGSPEGPPSLYAQEVHSRIRNQKFRTRAELLQALEMAIEMVEE